MDVPQESDPKSQDEIPVSSSFGKNFECNDRERSLKKISVVFQWENVRILETVGATAEYPATIVQDSTCAQI